MPFDLSETLVVGISATALFDLSQADNVFEQEYDRDKETAIGQYRQYVRIFYYSKF